jgi:hypothetical protein
MPALAPRWSICTTPMTVSLGGAMTNSDYPWESPLAGTEAEQLAGALDGLLVGEDPPAGWHAKEGHT